jgi:hypothetical protein
MYHIELRQFPHNFCRFNLTERELREAFLDAWARGEWIELGERKWNPHQANLTVLEGPRLPVDQLSMGRGWRNAKRQGEDVTARLLTAVHAVESAPGGMPARAVSPSKLKGTAEEVSSGARGDDRTLIPSAGSSFDMALAADSLGLAALAKLGEGAEPITIAWQLARERYPELPASDCLRLTEYAIRSLVTADLIDVLTHKGSGELELCVSAEQVERAMSTVESWTGTVGALSTLFRKK